MLQAACSATERVVDRILAMACGRFFIHPLGGQSCDIFIDGEGISATSMDAELTQSINKKIRVHGAQDKI